MSRQRASYVGNHGETYTGKFIRVRCGAAADLYRREGQDEDEAEWVPHSQIIKSVHANGETELTMSAWIAKKKGFID